MREGSGVSRAGRRRACRREEEEEEEEEGQWDPWRQMVVTAAATQTELKAKAGFHADPLILPLAMRTMRSNSLLVLSPPTFPPFFPFPRFGGWNIGHHLLNAEVGGEGGSDGSGLSRHTWDTPARGR